jgi:hypothetical protein
VASRKKGWVLALLVIAVVAALSIFVVQLREQRAAKRREAIYQSVLQAYASSFKPGMTRKEVEARLHNDGHQFGQMCCVPRYQQSVWTDLVEIGAEPAPWFCRSYNVYVALIFKVAEPPSDSIRMAHDSDRLVSVLLFPQLEGCL